MWNATALSLYLEHAGERALDEADREADEAAASACPVDLPR
jgi:hypothetical protein